MVRKLTESKSYEDRCAKYNEYLDNHIANVQLAFELCDKDLLIELTGVTEEDINCIQEQLSHHDESKYDSDEWDAYLDWFYPENEDVKGDEYLYDLAWVHHCHCNPHHYQYWTCIDDDGTVRAIDMPLSFVVEALCDWHSFSAKNPESTAYNWWQKHKDVFIMSDATKDLFDLLVVLFKVPLEEM